MGTQALLINMIAILALFVNIVYAQNDLPSWQTKLHNVVLKDYHSSVPPVHDGAVQVDLGFSLFDIDVEDKTGKVSAHGSSTRVWTDKRIRWKPEDYNGTTSLLVNDWYVWRPDIVMWNSGHSYETLDAEVIAYHNGTLMQFQSLQIDFNCRMDFRNFPFDKQRCQMMFGSWNNHEGVLNITDSAYANAGLYHPATDFKLLEFTAERRSMKFDCCLNPYTAVIYTFDLQRVSSAYRVKLVLPAVLSGFMVLATFLLPPASHEKITFCGLLFVGILLQLIYIHDVVPASGETMLADLLVFILFIDGFATTAAVLSYMKCPRKYPEVEPNANYKVEGEDGDLRRKLPVDWKTEIIRHFDQVLFVLFTIVFLIGMAIILGHHN